MGTIFFSFLLFYINLFLRFYSHVAGAGVVSMLWCMKDFQRHAAQLLEYLAFFYGLFYFGVSDGWLGNREGWDDSRLWLCKRRK